MKQTIHKEIKIDVEVEMNVNDIFNWLTSCDNAEELSYLGKYAIKKAKLIESGEQPDEMRSL